MRDQVIILDNGSREDACKKFDEVKKGITDFRHESVYISGNLRNKESGWRVIKIYL